MSVMPAARREGLLVKSLGDELVAMDTRGDLVHALSPAAAVVGKQCDGCTDMDDARLRSGLSFDEFQSALAELSAANLLDSRGFDRRTLLKGAATVGAGAVALPTVWTILAPPAMAANSGPTTTDNYSLAGSMAGYVSGASPFVPANGPFQFYAGPEVGAPADISMPLTGLHIFGDDNPDFFASQSAPAIKGFHYLPGVPDLIPLIEVNTGSAFGGIPAGGVAAHPGNGNSLVVAFATPSFPTGQAGTYTYNLTATDIDSGTGDDGVIVSLYAGGAPGSGAPAARVAGPSTALSGASASQSLSTSGPSVGQVIYAVIDRNNNIQFDSLLLSIDVAVTHN